jgi:hypothetical protein
MHSLILTTVTYATLWKKNVKALLCYLLISKPITGHDTQPVPLKYPPHQPVRKNHLNTTLPFLAVAAVQEASVFIPCLPHVWPITTLLNSTIPRVTSKYVALPHLLTFQLLPFTFQPLTLHSLTLPLQSHQLVAFSLYPFPFNAQLFFLTENYI